MLPPKPSARLVHKRLTREGRKTSRRERETRHLKKIKKFFKKVLTKFQKCDMI